LAEKIDDKALSLAAPSELQLSDHAIGTVKRNIKLCEQLVLEVLEREIDFGTIPGVPQPFLWDSGAAKIMAAFNCYAEYKVIDSVNQIPHIRYTITCQLINRQSQQIVATGIGAASTKEIKHRYRWVPDPEIDGISRKGLKSKLSPAKGDPERILYRIPNPDTEDLLNTIAKMASKRADVDAAQSLPGVAATLRKIFKGMTIAPPSTTSPGEQTKQDPETHNWRWFAAKLDTLGITHPQAREILRVTSIKDDWIGVQHRSLDEAYDKIKEAFDHPISPEEGDNDQKPEIPGLP